MNDDNFLADLKLRYLGHNRWEDIYIGKPSEYDRLSASLVRVAFGYGFGVGSHFVLEGIRYQVHGYDAHTDEYLVTSKEVG